MMSAKMNAASYLLNPCMDTGTSTISKTARTARGQRGPDRGSKDPIPLRESHWGWTGRLQFGSEVKDALNFEWPKEVTKDFHLFIQIRTKELLDSLKK